MLRGNLVNIILAVVICAAILYLIVPFDIMLKEKPHPLTLMHHEDPEIAAPATGSLPSFLFDPEYMSFVSQMDIDEVKAMVTDMPFLRNPQTLKEAVDKFTESGIYTSDMIAEINAKLGGLGESESDKDTQLKEISAGIKQAGLELKQIENAAQTTSGKFKIPATSAGSAVRMSYDEMEKKIARERETLDLEKEMLANLSRAGAVELPPTRITLEAGTVTAFVNDNLRFEGWLTFGGKPLAGREVNILLRSSSYVTVTTDAYGHYQGTLQIPYWCIPELDLQALYCPRDKDMGVYSASWSPVAKMKILSYQTGLAVNVEDKAYPGMETTVNAKFEYGQSPPADERKVEIYFDDTLISEVTAQEAFTIKIGIGPQVTSGKHVINVFAAAAGRYSSVAASARLNIVRAAPILDLKLPGVTIIPGSVGLEGKLHSEISPLNEASVKMKLGKSQVELASAHDGTFDTKIKLGAGFSLIGSQELEIQVLPREPWHAPLRITRSVLIVNAVSCGLLVVFILLLGIYLPARLRGRLGVHPGRIIRPEMVTAPPGPAPTYGESAAVPAAIKEGDETSADPRRKIFYWYRLVVRIFGETTRVLWRPQQTLREFASESSRTMGPAAKFFMELTRMVERLLYSPYSPTEQDVEKSRQLTRKIAGDTRTVTKGGSQE